MGTKFRNDYSEFAHKEILNAVVSASSEQNIGYGLDVHSLKAEQYILNKFGCKNGKVFFVTGGTQANVLVLSYLLKPYEGVISCDTGHINVHETAAVESTGHKIIVCQNENGKLTADNVRKTFNKFVDEHMVKPKIVYISNSTETGTIYTKSELLSLRKVCDELGLILYMDGARLGVALTCYENDVDPSFISKVCDVFYIGGTKNGFLSGEAIVFKDKKICEDFRYHLKNKCAMLAKGFVVSAQFERAFKDNLYFDIAKNANETAKYIRKELNGLVAFTSNSPTNQIFIKLDKNKADKVIKEFDCELWTDLGNTKIIRIVTSFATTFEDCDKIISFIKQL